MGYLRYFPSAPFSAYVPDLYYLYGPWPYAHQNVMPIFRSQLHPALALGAYFYAFIPMLFGIILLATGIESSIEHLTSRLDPAQAFVFRGGVSLYLIGTIIFRRVSVIPDVTYRYAAAALAVLTGFLGVNLSAGLQFGCLIMIVIALIFAESNWGRQMRRA